ncbi:hypothetical protein SDC9_28869 [bioreactor metagenome]|uniref:DUF192 domain-containing protein n=1 Tax=bioreactor metagenome TaxID=1076179 RepID=A0A644UV26_9ZZZZ|nr:DUF192 domain-containing protein [Methanobrevibacter sp.]MEA4956782.1 DUF192 domain-containing protein [Methanobrevibacter sp.]
MINNKTILIKKENDDEKEIVLGPVKFADSYLSRLKGLMFEKRLDYILIIKTAKKNTKFYSSIHTFFMYINIDVIFLNENKEVTETTCISPWKIYKPRHRATYIIELKKGSIEKNRIKIGDKLDFVCEFN